MLLRTISGSMLDVSVLGEQLVNLTFTRMYEKVRRYDEQN